MTKTTQINGPSGCSLFIDQDVSSSISGCSYPEKAIVTPDQNGISASAFRHNGRIMALFVDSSTRSMSPADVNSTIYSQFLAAGPWQ